MNYTEGLQRFLTAQEGVYENALAEVENGRKTSHWMWFIFPQMKGLGFSETAIYYGIESKAEAEAYLNDPILGKRLKEITTALLMAGATDANRVFGCPDNLKLKSSMTLFAALPGSAPCFREVLEKFFNGQEDERTLALLNK
jgi:uncharacterized protein (DUF1810 family)